MQTFKKYLKKNFPALHKILGIIYTYIINFFQSFFGTSFHEKKWKERTGNNWIIEGYWKGIKHAHRQFLIKYILEKNIKSVLEIGCNCGPNLRILLEKNPHLILRGIDINAESIDIGNKKFKQMKKGDIKLFERNIDNLTLFSDNSFDVVFSDAVLIYIAPDKIKNILQELLRISSKRLVLLEQNNHHKSKYCGHWIHNYKKLLSTFIPIEKIELIKLPYHIWPDKY